MGKQELVGHVGVDAGLIWVGDPCYIMGDDATSRVRDWGDFCGLLDNDKEVHAPLGDMTGLAIHSGWGDGLYPVYVEMEQGRPMAIHVYFNDDPNNPHGN